MVGLEPCVGTFPRILQLSSDESGTITYLCNRDHYISTENPENVIEKETAEEHASGFIVWQGE